MRKHTLSAGALLCLLGLTSGWAQAGTPTYTITDLGRSLTDGTEVDAVAINTSGQALLSAPAADGSTAAYLSQNGGLQSLGQIAFPGDAGGQLAGLSDAGLIAGTSYKTDGAPRGFLLTDGAYTDLGSLGGPRGAFAYGVNKAGHVVGAADTGSGIAAFLYSGGVLRALPFLPGSGNGACGAYGVNGADQVVGFAQYGLPDADGNTIQHAALWQGGAVQDLGSLVGPSGDSFAEAINDHAQIVGASANAAGNYDAFFLSGGAMQDLGTLGGVFSDAHAVNNSAQVVGEADTGQTDAYGYPVTHAFLWQNGALTDLNTALPADSGWVLTRAVGVNDAGRIVGTGQHTVNGVTYTHAFVLTPVVAAAPVLRINAGGGADAGVDGPWQADADYSGGATWQFSSPVAGTSDPDLFRSVRYSDTGFSYKLPAAPGAYTLKLYFLEGDKTGPGQRLFNVSVNGSPVLSGFDVFKDAGGQGIADVKSFPVTSDGSGVTVSFRSVAINAMVSALELVPAGPPTVAAPPTGLTALPGDKLATLSWAAAAGATSYNLYRGTSAGGEGATPVATGLTGTTYADAGLANGTAYYYKVTAVNSAGESALSSEAAVAPQAPTLRINAGGGAYAGVDGPWQADADYSGGTTYLFSSPVMGTSDPDLYRTVRYSLDSFSYRLPAAAGAYTLRLHFLEGDKTGVGQRVFSVSVNGSPALSGFDVFKDAGGRGIADVKSFPVTSDGSGVTVSFQSFISTAMVSALELVPAAGNK